MSAASIKTYLDREICTGEPSWSTGTVEVDLLCGVGSSVAGRAAGTFTVTGLLPPSVPKSHGNVTEGKFSW